ncbi:unnamed protein product, partial [Vitis vinifera]|uniref:Uncharacterized protein n=1 Tax=Vitis vinifera TaxID=29760 RepID=D7SL48_VITVI
MLSKSVSSLDNSSPLKLPGALSQFLTRDILSNKQIPSQTSEFDRSVGGGFHRLGKRSEEVSNLMWTTIKLLTQLNSNTENEEKSVKQAACSKVMKIQL